jgi:hypothetical protein
LDELAERQLEILRNDSLTEREKKNLLRILKREGELRFDIQNVQARQAREALKEREEQQRKTEELKKQKELQKQQLDDLKAQQAEAEKASNAIRDRLGEVGSTSSTKRGFTESASTAMGTFKFGEQGAQDAIKQLQKESRDLQQQMSDRLQAIENLVRAMNQSMGFG